MSPNINPTTPGITNPASLPQTGGAGETSGVERTSSGQYVSGGDQIVSSSQLKSDNPVAYAPGIDANGLEVPGENGDKHEVAKKEVFSKEDRQFYYELFEQAATELQRLDPALTPEAPGANKINESSSFF